MSTIGHLGCSRAENVVESAVAVTTDDDDVYFELVGRFNDALPRRSDANDGQRDNKTVARAG